MNKQPSLYRLLLCLVLTSFVTSLSANATLADEGDRTSFENHPAGLFDKSSTVETAVGSWLKAKGMVSIDSGHAKSGKQCLQIAGRDASVVLDIADGIKTDGQLSFWAERWTSRSPFRFRIEKNSGGAWSEIYDGDQEVRVGRAFLSHIKVPLHDSEISQLRFTVSSPEGTGILIDDFGIAPAVPQEVTGLEIVPLALPALSGTEASAIVKLKITTRGTLNPISVRSVKASLAKSAELKFKRIRLYFGGAQSDFEWNTPFADSRLSENQILVFEGDQELLEGDNYLWLGGELKPTSEVNIDATLAGTIDSVTFSNGQVKEVEGPMTMQRMGVAVRKGGDEGVHTFRIPGLVTTNAGTLIGVYDVRRDGGGDLPGNIDVGMSRSTDGGRNWEPMKVIMDMGHDPKWRGDGIGDPAILVDRETGTIWVSATWSHGNRSWHGSGPGVKPDETGQWILVKSDDDGATWSKPINITKQVKNPAWSFLLQGPGKGITMSDGTLVFPAQYQDPPNPTDKVAHRLPHSTFIYSRDRGATWKVAKGAWDDTTESQIVELADGELMLNCRNNRSSKRAVMTTDDLGETWHEHATHVKSLIEPGSCMASLINVGRELGWRDVDSEFNNDFLLFSNPDSLRGRNHMTIKASLDGGVTWPVEHQLLLDEQGSAGYSCLTMIDAETVGILYEGSQAQMTFQRIKIEDILNPPHDQKTKNPALALNRYVPARQASVPTKLSLSRAFGDHMVLQVNQPIRIWGKAKPLADVKASFLSEVNSIRADEQGNWQVTLPARRGYERSGSDLVVESDSETVIVRDVLVGEVWLCAGQSNMEWELQNSERGPEAIANSADPLLRLLNCRGESRGNEVVYSTEQSERLYPESFSEGNWQIASQESSEAFSAVGYYFSRRLRDELDVPVGIINVSVGGTPIESWVSTNRLRRDSNLDRLFDGDWLENPLLNPWCRDRAKHNLRMILDSDMKMPGDRFGPNHSFKPGFMHEAGIRPFSPLAIRGVLWYQGESNADTPERTQVYDRCFPLLIADLRSQFENPNLPVVFVQLPAMGRTNWPVFREYQRRSLEKLKNVGMAITIDTGHPTNVHPGEKQPVGNRLAQWALVNTYEQSGVAMGPLFKSTVSRGDEIEVSFEFVGRGLKTKDAQDPRHFEVAGSDGVFYPAKARIVKDKIHVSSESVNQPVHVRYAWEAFPEPMPNLINSEGLPASPFASQESFD